MGARSSAPIQTGPGAYRASYTMGTGSFPGVMRPGHGVDHPPPSIAKIEERVELYKFAPLLGLLVLFQGEYSTCIIISGDLNCIYSYIQMI